MDFSGLLSMLKWIGTIFPIFNIEFPFHIAYDIIIRLASSWILEDSVGEIAGFFNSAFGSAIRYMYDMDQPFLKMCLDMWKSTTKFALALLPLMLLLSIFSTVKYGSERSSLTMVKTRELAFGTILNVGLAASSYWIFTKVLVISTALGKQMLAISGITVTTNFSEIAERIFLPSMITHLDGSSEALLVVLMFLRLFLTLVLFISIVLVSVSTRIGILLLFGISPVCFVLSVYEEFDWVRDSWIKTFIGFILTPVFDGILLALIMLNNEKFVSGMSMGEVFKTLCISIGISCMIVVLHSEVIKKIFDSLIADIKKAVRAVKIAAQVISRYGAVLNYLTRFVYEVKQSNIDFGRLLSSLETDETGAFKTRTTRQLTGRGYSIGFIADPSFVFLTIADTDAVLFRDNDSVIGYYAKVTSVF